MCFSSQSRIASSRSSALPSWSSTCLIYYFNFFNSYFFNSLFIIMSEKENSENWYFLSSIAVLFLRFISSFLFFFPFWFTLSRILLFIHLFISLSSYFFIYLSSYLFIYLQISFFIFLPGRSSRRPSLALVRPSTLRSSPAPFTFTCRLESCCCPRLKACSWSFHTH